MLKNMKPEHKYFIINIDEPYAEEIYEVLKRGQIAKSEWPEGDISFDEWKEWTFGEFQAKEVAFKVIRDIVWDNWGHPIRVFVKGDIRKGYLYPDGTVTAESPYYKGITDILRLDYIEIL